MDVKKTCRRVVKTGDHIVLPRLTKSSPRGSTRIPCEGEAVITQVDSVLLKPMMKTRWPDSSLRTASG